MSDSILDVDISVDKMQLDYEWERQVQLTQMVTGEFAVVSSKRFEFEERLKQSRLEYKNNLETLSASLEVQMRSNPSEFGISKVTESTISAFINSHPDIIEIKENFASSQEKLTRILKEFKKQEEVLDGRKIAVTSRVPILKNLTKLYFDGYYSSSYNHGIMKNPKNPKKGGSDGEN